MNKRFMFLTALLMSIILGSGFTIADQIAMAAVITYPNTNTLYDNSYNSSDDKYSSNYGEPEYVYYPSYNNNNDKNDNNTYTNNDKYSDSYSKPSNTYNNNNYNNNDYNNKNNNDSYESTDDDKYSDSYDNSDKYSKYPTNDKLHECQKGPLEGFFTSSVEFCIAA